MKKSYFAILMLSLYGFMNPFGIFSEQIVKLFIYIIIIIGFAIAFGSANRERKSLDYPRKTFWTLIFGITISILMAYAFHAQSLSVSFMTTLPFILGYGTLYMFLKLHMPEKDIIQVFFWLTVIAIPIYFANAATFPNMMFGGSVEKGEDISRGIVRIPVYYLDIMTMFVFYGINQWHLNKSKKWVLWAIICMIMVFLSVTRQYILFSAALALIFMLKNSKWYTKISIVGLAALLIFVLLPAIPAYQAMVELSEKQSEKNEKEDDIRVQAYEFYLNTYQTNEITRFLGNGMPSFGNSSWGNMVDSELNDNGCFFVDIGWGGFYWLFGLFAVIALLLLFLQAMLRTKSPPNKFLSYWMAFFILICLASGANLFIEQIIVYMAGVYLCFKPQNFDNNKNLDNFNSKTIIRRGLYQLRIENDNINNNSIIN